MYKLRMNIICIFNRLGFFKDICGIIFSRVHKLYLGYLDEY